MCCGATCKAVVTGAGAKAASDADVLPKGEDTCERMVEDIRKDHECLFGQGPHFVFLQHS